MIVLASKVRKGQKIFIEGVLVEVTKREKWNSTDVKIHFKDCGNGLPKSSGWQKLCNQFGKSQFFKLDTELTLG